jgi:hypothetical protein
LIVTFDRYKDGEGSRNWISGEKSGTETGSRLSTAHQLNISFSVSDFLAFHNDRCRSRRALDAALLELFNDVIKIRVARAKTSCDPVSTAPGNFLAIREHLKLTGLARCNHGINAEPFFDKSHETRDLRFVVLSRRAGTYLNFHFQGSKGEKVRFSRR